MKKFTIKDHACRNFDDMKEFLNAIGRTLTVISWGAHAWTNIQNKALKFKVQGHHFKGWVILTVNGSDLFDIYYVNRKLEILDSVTDIYLEDLIDVIDIKVERIKEYVR